jgi:hypothetical protein
MIYIYLAFPIITLFIIYCVNYKDKKNLFFEAYLGLNTLCFCAYYLLHYRIHHSYKYLKIEDFYSAIYLFYFLFIITLSFIFILKKKKLKKINIEKRLIFLNITNNENKIIFFLIFVGFILFTINRSSFLICENGFLNNVYKNDILKSLFMKFHTISYFGVFMIFCGIILFANKNFKNSLKIELFKWIAYIIFTLLLFILILYTSSSVSLIILFVLISSLIFHPKSKKVFFSNLILISLFIINVESIKSELRKEISPISYICKTDLINTVNTLLSESTNFKILNNEDKFYMLENGVYEKVDISTKRYVLANFFERADFLQMLAQIKYLDKNNKIELKYGETYFNPKKNWQKKFGVDLKQANEDDISSFNMPASIESYYNFGVQGFILFSFLMSLIVFSLSYFLNLFNSQNLNIIFTTIFLPFLNLENHLIFMIKNSLYIGLMILIPIILINLIFSNNKFPNT